MSDTPRQLTIKDSCSRSACNVTIEGETRWRIWNRVGCDPSWRDYCVSCGRRIMAANPTLSHLILTEDEVNMLKPLENSDG